MQFFSRCMNNNVALDLCRSVCVPPSVAQEEGTCCSSAASDGTKTASRLFFLLETVPCVVVFFFFLREMSSIPVLQQQPPPPPPQQPSPLRSLSKQNARHANGSRRYHFETQHRLGKMVDPLIQSPFLLFSSHLSRPGHN